MSGERITCKLAHGGVYLEIPQFNIAQIAFGSLPYLRRYLDMLRSQVGTTL